MSMRNAQLLCLLLILVLGVFLRFETARRTIVDHPIRNDAKEYVAYAANMQFFGVYSLDLSRILGRSSELPKPDAFRPPGYPWFLRLFLGRQLDIGFVPRVVYGQAFVASVTLLCATLIAMRIVGAWAGLVVGFLVAVSPHQSIYVAYLLTETLYGSVLMLSLATGVLCLDTKEPRRRYLMACVCGFLFALTCLVRQTLDQWVLVLVFLTLVPSVRRFKREILALTLGFLVTMSPWWARNEISLHRMSDPGKMLATVHQGSYPNFMYRNRPETFGYPYRFDPDASSIESSWSNVFADLHIKFVSQPVAMADWYLFGKTAYFFRWSPPDGWLDMFTYPVWSPWLTDSLFVNLAAFMWSIYIPLILCGIIGTFFAFLPRTRVLFSAAQTDGIRFLALLHLYVIGVHVMGAPFSRYSVPFRPLTFLLAVFFVVWLLRSYTATKNIQRRWLAAEPI